MKGLKGKVAFVTGSSRGIGRAAALELARAGSSVIFHGTAPSAALDSAAAEAGTDSLKLTADFSDLQAVELLAEKLIKEQWSRHAEQWLIGTNGKRLGRQKQMEIICSILELKS